MKKSMTCFVCLILVLCLSGCISPQWRTLHTTLREQGTQTKSAENGTYSLTLSAGEKNTVVATYEYKTSAALQQSSLTMILTFDQSDTAHFSAKSEMKVSILGKEITTKETLEGTLKKSEFSTDSELTVTSYQREQTDAKGTTTSTNAEAASTGALKVAVERSVPLLKEILEDICPEIAPKALGFTKI